MDAGFLEAFFRIFGLKTGFDIIIALLTRKRVQFSMDNVRLALSLSGMKTSYRLLRKITNPTIAGSLSSVLLAVNGQKSQRVFIALNFLTRAILFGIRSLIYKKPVQKSLESKERELIEYKYPFKQMAEFVDKYGTYFAWHAMSMHICYVSFNYPEWEPLGYYKSLLHITGHKRLYGKDIIPVMRALADLLKLSVPEIYKIPENMKTSDYISELSSRNANYSPIIQRMVPLQVLKKGIHHSQIVCAFQHPKIGSCELAALGIANNLLKQAVPLYALLNSFPLLRLLLKSRKEKVIYSEALKRYAISVFRSCIMLASFTGLFGYTLCTLRRIYGRDLGIFYGVAGLIAAPSILIEKQARLVDLVAFCAGKVMESTYLTLRDLTGMKIPYGELMYFLPSMAVLANCAEYNTHTIHGYYHVILKWIFST